MTLASCERAAGARCNASSMSSFFWVLPAQFLHHRVQLLHFLRAADHIGMKLFASTLNPASISSRVISSAMSCNTFSG
jgi:hypothetical protein